MFLVLVTTISALLVAGIALLLNDIRDYRRGLSAELTTEAQILALSTAPALQFDDRAAAKRNVEALQARQEILVAAIYDAKQNLYAAYVRAGQSLPGPIVHQSINKVQFSGGHLALSYPIERQGERWGTVYLLGDYNVAGRVAAYVGVLSLVTGLSVLIALLLSGQLQRAIVEPLDAIAVAARQVIRNRDYSLRVTHEDGSEIGLVIEAFNQMLDEVLRHETSLRDEIKMRAVTESALARTNAELERALQALRSSDRRKDEFLATLAHELRNPLAPISHAVKLLSYASTTEGQRTWGYELISRQVRRMALLLDDLLDISRITRGRLELKREYVDLRTLVEAAIETARPMIDGRGHVLTVSLPEERLELDVDPLRLSQALSNLLTNAAKYTDESGRLALDASLEDQDLVIRVSDNGIGLGADSMPAIFEMFSQVESAKQRSQGGLGIGLALVKGIVTLHGGSVSVDSPGLGYGSRFTIRLPRAVVVPQAASAGSERRSAQLERGTGCVLVADDNRDSADSLALLLRAAGYECVVAYSGSEAWEIAARRHPQVMLLDIGMPGLNGYDVARRTRQSEWGNAALLIAATGWGQAGDISEAKEAGFDEHFTKPVSVDRLLHLLAEFSRIRQASAKSTGEMSRSSSTA